MLLTCRLSQSRTQAKGVPGSPDRGGAWHEKPSDPTEGRAARAAGGALRQTTAAALALMSEETENNHPRTTTPSLSYWVCSCSASPNIQIFPPWVFIRTFLSSGFCSQFLFHPPATLVIALSSWEILTVPPAPLANHSTPSSSLRRKGLEVSFLLQIYPATR